MFVQIPICTDTIQETKPNDIASYSLQLLLNSSKFYFI